MEKLIIFQQFIILLALHFFSILPSSSAYTPPADYFINCGSNSNFNSNDGRNFVGDQRSGIPFSVGQGSTVQDTSPSAGVSPLYHSARTYRQPSFYEFMIKESGTYFVRLHFFVSSSSNNLASAIFSVIASDFSLLSNFSVKNNPGLPVIKEFFVNVRAGRFRIYFVPTEGSNLAFINAIEVFLTPEKFINDTAPLITPADGRRNSFNNLQSQVLHTLYRINVGGPILTPENDTLWRNWIPDDSFLFNPRAARNSSFFSDEPKYQLGTVTEYIAPSPVYRTAKELDIEESRQLNLSNITWRFNVGKSSRHFVRLHFCDIIAESFDSIVFNLSFYNKFVKKISPYEQTVQLATPFYFDFVVDSDASGIMNISIGPRSDSLDQNAFLNGIEIMEFTKKSDIVLPPEKLKSKRRNLFPVVGSVVGAAFVIILIVAVLVGLKCRKTKPAQSSSWPLSLPLYGGGSSYDRMSGKTANMSPSNLNLALRISYYEIEQSTKNFDSSLLIGEGGFGKVYEEYALQLQLTPMNSGPHEDSTTNASLEFSMPVLHRLPSNNLPVVDEDDTTVLFDDGSGVTASQVFSTLRLWEGSDWILPNGLFGHGVDNTSVPSILAKEKLVSNSFTLCFGYDGVGRITFGNKGSSDQGETPLNLRQSHPTYNVSVTQIKVGGNAGDLEFNAIFDSGTSFTYLNDPAYTLISESWQPASKCLDRNCRPGKKTIEPPTKARNTNHAMAHVKPRAHTQTKATPLQCLPSDLNFQTFHGAFSCLSRFQFLLAFPLIKAPE
ncbi:hypothetical protein V6N13_111480 [Hibiscus sabdariffa]